MNQAEGAPPVLVVRDERFCAHMRNMFHLENAKRILVANEALAEPDLKDKWLEVEPDYAGADQLAWIHRRSYIEEIAKTARCDSTPLDLDTHATRETYDTARLAAGGIFRVIDRLMEGPARRGFAFVRPPGHHAETDRAMGFCIFNNPALGAAYLRNAWGLKRILVADIDAHHGNGIQQAFYSSREVLYFSLHQYPGFPGTGNFNETGDGPGSGYTVNVPVGKGCGDRHFTELVHRVLKPVAESYLPEFVLVCCGFDLHYRDRLGGMRASPEGYAMLAAQLTELAERLCGGRILFIMEGGYSLEGIRQCTASVMRQMCGYPGFSRQKLERFTTGDSGRFSEKAVRFHKQFWKTLA